MMRTFLVGLLIAAFATLASAQQSAEKSPPEYSLRENYTKYEYRIPMRDGKKLFTAVLVPKDQSKPFPFMVQRTPYSVEKYGVERGRIVSYSDEVTPTRGRELSVLEQLLGTIGQTPPIRTEEEQGGRPH